MRSSTKLRVYFAFSVFSLALTLTTAAEAAPERQSAFVQEALTGDSVRLRGGKILKYAGMASPPLQHRVPLVRTYGENALQFNKSLVEGKKILIEWDSQVRDNLGNLLGYVFLEDGRFVNLEVLKAGGGRAVATPPNLRYSGALRRAALEARRAKRGLWKEEPDNPFIKSEYLGEMNTKIFYFPDSAELDRIPASHLVKFRSRVEAVAAGYKPCDTCKEDRDVEY